MAFYSAGPVRFGVGISGNTLTLGVNDPKLGDVIYDNGNKYRFVYNGGGVIAGIGHCVVLASGTSQYTVTVSSVVTTQQPFGVVANAVAIPVAAYAWVLAEGFTKLCPVTALVSGDPLHLCASGHVEPPIVATASTAADNPQFAVAMEQTAACGTARCYVKCLG